MGPLRHHPDGRRVILPSEIESLAQVHGLTIPEAEILSYRAHVSGQDPATVAAAIKSERVVYRQSYDQLETTAENHPLVELDAKKAKAERDKAKSG